MSSIRTLFIVPNRGSSFIEQDIRILSRHFEVNCVPYRTLGLLPEILKPILTRAYDLTYLWFVYHYALPVSAACKAAKIPCVLVPSGVDVANNPEIGYGQMQFREARIRTKTSLRLSTLVLPVSDFVKRLVLRLTRPKLMRVIHNGIDTEKFKPHGAKEDIILTVAGISERNFLYKRLDVFVKSAKFLPNYRFMLVGKHIDGTVQRLKAMAPPNVDFLGQLSNADLLRLYQRARVYVQVSHEEAFGCALAEAMACECVPVVVRRGALPEIVGGTGYYALYADPAGTAQTIMQAFAKGDGTSARRRIERMFTVKRRELELIKALKSVCG
ncbi:MAG: glycosyltransferase family 4 protein [Candidatus Bathyarchaeia archaeon]